MTAGTETMAKDLRIKNSSSTRRMIAIQPLVESACPLGRAVQPLAQPVVHGIPHRVGARGPNSGIHFLVQRLELFPDSLLRSAEDFPPDPLPVGPLTK
jgi:hypothetical protein